jgi:hypothetical protein
LITHSGVAKPGETAVVELEPNGVSAAGGEWIEITPLPKDWVPDPSTW